MKIQEWAKDPVRPLMQSYLKKISCYVPCAVLRVRSSVFCHVFFLDLLRLQYPQETSSLIKQDITWGTPKKTITQWPWTMKENVIRVISLAYLHIYYQLVTLRLIPRLSIVGMVSTSPVSPNHFPVAEIDPTTTQILLFFASSPPSQSILVTLLNLWIIL